MPAPLEALYPAYMRAHRVRLPHRVSWIVPPQEPVRRARQQVLVRPQKMRQHGLSLGAADDVPGLRIHDEQLGGGRCGGEHGARVRVVVGECGDGDVGPDRTVARKIDTV